MAEERNAIQADGIDIMQNATNACDLHSVTAIADQMDLCIDMDGGGER